MSARWRRRRIAKLPKLLIIGASGLTLTVAGGAHAAIARIDSALMDGAVASPSGAVAGVARRVTTLGSTDVVLMVAAFALALLATVRHWRGVLGIALALAATQAAVFAAKTLVARPRPSEAIVHVSDFSFPSGHAATAVALYGLLTSLAARACHGLARVAIAVVGGAITLPVGVSRVVLGVHYPSDVIAGWLIAGAIALAAWVAVEPVRGPAARRGGSLSSLLHPDHAQGPTRVARPRR